MKRTTRSGVDILMTILYVGGSLLVVAKLMDVSPLTWAQTSVPLIAWAAIWVLVFLVALIVASFGYAADAIRRARRRRKSLSAKGVR
jgi:hypothetical protein